MKYLETILSFVITFARLVIGRKRKKEPQECPCSTADDRHDAVSPDAGNGSDAHGDRNAALPLQGGTGTISPVNILGWGLIIATFFY